MACCRVGVQCKASSWESGIRVPGMIHIPWVILENKNVSTPATTADFLPTIMAIFKVESGEWPLMRRPCCCSTAPAILCCYLSTIQAEDCGLRTNSCRSPSFSVSGLICHLPPHTRRRLPAVAAQTTRPG